MALLSSIPIIGNIVDAIGSIGKAWMEKKKIEAQGKVQIAQAKVDGEVKRIQTQVEGDIQYDVTAAEGMRYSWKDEAFVIVWLAVFVGAFIPQTQEYVRQGFAFMKDNTPWWYEYSLVGMVAASFGLKTWNFWNQIKKP